MTLIDFFDYGLSLNRRGDCLEQDGLALSYEEVAGYTHRMAWGLQAAGVGRGERIATLSPNNLWAYVALLGTQRVGCVWVPLNARSSLEDHVKHLQRTSCAWVFYHSVFADDIEQIRARVPGIKGFTCVDDAQDFARLLPDDARRFPPPTDDPRHDMYKISLSGGTTGEPKAVVQTQFSLQTNVATALTLHEPASLSRYLLCMPMTHAAGSKSFPTLAVGGTVHILEKPAAQAILQSIQDRRITSMMLTPTAVYSMLGLPEAGSYDLSSMRNLSVGGAPMSVEKLRQAFELLGPVVTQGYGQTEAASALTEMSARDYQEILDDPALAHRLASCGRVTPYTRLEIMSPTGELLPRGEKGELVVRSGMVMQGYLDDPAGTAESRKFGWHHTGDIGHIDEDGFVYITDRVRDLIVTGGFNVFPLDIEQVIWTHPGVEDCAVIGLPDEKWGEAVVAVVQRKPGATVSEQEIIDLCKARLGSVKTPKSVVFMGDLPRSEVGKVLKKTLRSTLAAPAGAA